MKKDIEFLLETYNLESYDPQNPDDVSKLIIKIMQSEAQDDYFKILSTYNKYKKAKKLNISNVSEGAGVPTLTVRRFENLQHFPNVLTLINILHAVGLKLSVTPIESECSQQNK